MTMPTSRLVRRKKHRATRVATGRAFSFETTLGWIGITHVDDLITEIKFGYDTQSKLCGQFDRSATVDGWRFANELNDFEHGLQTRFSQFAAGEPDEFEDLEIDQSGMTPFQRVVTDACRAIPYGETLSYAGLAAASGSPKAARAVGSVMRNNRYPLVVPCHRVVSSDRRIGGFSAPEGVTLKLRLLRLEGITDFASTQQVET